MSDTVTNNNTTTMSEQFDSVIDKLNENISSMKLLLAEVKQLKKDASKSMKTKKEKKEKDPNKPAPFTKPVVISDELRNFLNQEDDISRTEVTKKMYKYIKENNLQNPDMKREFIVDDKLAKLFKIEKGTHLGYFNVQTHMKQHYPK